MKRISTAAARKDSGELALKMTVRERARNVRLGKWEPLKIDRVRFISLGNGGYMRRDLRGGS